MLARASCGRNKERSTPTPTGPAAGPRCSLPPPDPLPSVRGGVPGVAGSVKKKVCLRRRTVSAEACAGFVGVCGRSPPRGGDEVGVWGWRRGSGDPVCQPRIRACPIRQANAASCDCTHSWCRQGRGASRLPGQFVWPKKRPQRSRCFIQPEPRWNPGAPFPAGVPERRFRSRTDSTPVTRLRFGPCLYGLHGRHVTAGAATPRGVARRRGGTRGSWFRRARPPAAPAGESGGGRCVPFRSRIRFLFECGTFAQRRYLPPPPEGTFLPQNGAGRALPPRTSTDAPHPQSPGPPVRRGLLRRG